MPKGCKPFINWTLRLTPGKTYKVSVAIKRTTPEGGGVSMSMSTDICTGPWLGATKTPKLNAWQVFEGEIYVTVAQAYNWAVQFHPSLTGDVYYDSFNVVEK